MSRRPSTMRKQLSLLPDSAARTLGAGRRPPAESAPAVRAVRLRNERRFKEEFINLTVIPLLPGPPEQCKRENGWRLAETTLVRQGRRGSPWASSIASTQAS